MAEEYYNVWVIDSKRWTNHGHQDPKCPKQMTYDEAAVIAKYLTNCCCPCEVRPLTAKTAPVVEAVSKIDTLAVAINDHTCKWCGNNRCSKTEKSCWKCGGKLS